MPAWNRMLNTVKGLFQKDRRAKLILMLGLAGMVLILFSQFSVNSSLPEVESLALEEDSADLYISQLEEKLSGLLSEIEGVGRAQVMVTLENAGEIVYAQEEKRNVDRTMEPGGEEGGKVTQKENIEQKFILVESSYGQKQALVKTQLQPKIQGVVIVCEGADDIRVQQSLINVVTTALGIPSTRVCVVKIN